MGMKAGEKKAYELAYNIASVGASNPIGAAHGVWEVACALQKAGFDSDGVANHPAYRAAVGHLSFLANLSLGPERQDLTKVEEVHAQMEAAA